MINKTDKERLRIILVLLVALIFFAMTQSNPPIFILLPIILFTLGICWYLYHEIKKDQQENLKRGIHYMQDEKEAQVWLHRSFVPKVKRLVKKEMRPIITVSGLLLVSFIFLWSFFVAGFFAAILNTLIGLFFFLTFLIYALYTPHEFNHIFNHLPERYRHHSKNDWVHAYILLFPFAMVGFFFYSVTTTGEGLLGNLTNTVVFLFSYTFLFICVYCLWYLYTEYQKDTEQSLKKTAKKILEEE
jgi:hypothetical protein